MTLPDTAWNVGSALIQLEKVEGIVGSGLNQIIGGVRAWSWLNDHQLQAEIELDGRYWKEIELQTVGGKRNKAGA